ncbi:hypothetical protein [Streptomyces poonensis]|uniref:Uncharacterized protein n=1 Tax=Streptomyces poonensis TaxID=68255 RepID=A0A918Q5Y3_9ACTN|nr:hypothetical protein [Streptomyces poonensis]GGZ32106.1 hypothetical protein GCM10010365_61030 [Streptomyces poonensis]GLJ93409.1 hypothetical protein GCM10017589_60210 [Streptomyces poonensis]
MARSDSRFTAPPAQHDFEAGHMSFPVQSEPSGDSVASPSDSYADALTVDTDVTDLLAADHLLRTLASELVLPEDEDVIGCTHLMRDDRPRVVLSFALPTREARDSAHERLTAMGYEVTDGVPDEVGRAVLYPGVASLTGTVTVAELLSRSAIDRVTVLGTQEPPAPDTELVTREHVRPQWQNGELVLAAMPAVGGRLVPFEVPDPTPCCADH